MADGLLLELPSLLLPPRPMAWEWCLLPLTTCDQLAEAHTII